MPKHSDDQSGAGRRPFWRRFATGMGMVSVIALAMYLLVRLHIIFPIEVLGEDFVFGGSPGATALDDVHPGVTLVEITDEDYECPSLFAGKNPLRRDLIYELINKAAAAKAVVVDIDLSGSWEPPPRTTYKPGDLACSNGKRFPFSPPPTLDIASDKLVLVEPTRIVRGPRGNSIPVLANDKVSVLLAGNTEARKAVSVFPYDWDHRARSFLKQVEVRKGSKGDDLAKCKSFPTLPMVGYRNGLPPEGEWKDCEPAREEDRFFINFAKSTINHRYTASEVLT